MNDKTKNIVVTVVFCIMIFGIFIINLVKAPSQISISERRPLKQFPNLSFETVFKPTKENPQFMSEFESYVLDQFWQRDKFREIKAFSMYNIFKRSDNNGIYLVDGQVSKYSNKMNEVEIKENVKKLNKLYNDFLKDMNVYYSIIPDKNYYIAEENGYPHIDYEKFENIVCGNMNENMTYIDLFDSLTVNDYYRTDTHWRQEKLESVVTKLASVMNFKTTDNYEEKVLENFYGVYYGQSALPIDSEEMIYLTNETLENAKVHVYTVNEKATTNSDILKKEETKIYVESDYKNNDPYDIFLGGPEMLIEIENENAKTDKELYIFRDSYGSSLSPLLVEGYRKITIIDLRYIATPILKEFVTFEEENDVLIINCTDVLGTGGILKVF